MILWKVPIVMESICSFLQKLDPSDWVTLVVGLTTAIIIICQLRILSQQIKLQNFSDYTKRYQSIILNFPEDINEDQFELEGHKDYANTMRYMRAYVDLCFEEWFLNKNNLIDKRFWKVWKGGMETAFSKPAFRQAWDKIQADSKFGDEFDEYVKQRMSNKSSNKKTA